MRKILLVAASMASLGLVQPALAADVIEPVPSWTGFHLGIGGGAGYNTYDAESVFDKDFFDEGGSPRHLSIKADDLGAWHGFGTVEVGFDYQFDNSQFLIGILANYDFNGDSSADAESFTFEDDGNFSESAIEAELGDAWFLGGRLGFVMNENTLLYGLGGYTWVKGKVEAFHELVEDGNESAALFDDDDNVDGWTIGAGIEHLLTESLSLKLEYRHDFLDNIEWDGFAFDPNEGEINEDNRHYGKVDFSRDTVRAVLSWRFNPDW